MPNAVLARHNVRAGGAPAKASPQPGALLKLLGRWGWERAAAPDVLVWWIFFSRSLPKQPGIV